MRTLQRTGALPALASIVLATALVFIGCTADRKARIAEDPDNDAASVETAEELSAAELWSRNCMRCHNHVSPDRYSDAEWDVVMHHMRVRANLTGEDHRRIRDFLTSAN